MLCIWRASEDLTVKDNETVFVLLIHYVRSATLGMCLPSYLIGKSENLVTMHKYGA